MLTIIAITAILSLVAITNAQDPQPVNELFTDRYRGRWYALHTSLFVKLTAERDGFCGTADYNLRPDGSISVLNVQRIGGPTGVERNITGSAFPTNVTGVFRLKLDPVSVEGNYIVYRTGPLTYGVENRYEYSIVSEPSKLNTFVLVRDVVDFRRRFEREILAWMDTNGFNTEENPLLPSYHEQDCVYAERQEIVPVPSIDLTKYVGRWYQTYISQYTYNQTQGLGYCATADYSANADGTVAVYNSQNIGEIGGPPFALPGTAFPTNRTAIFKVALNGIPRLGDYWVIKLGPLTFGPDNFYEYAVVSEPKKYNLFVLARNIADYYQRFDAEVRTFLDKEGFNQKFNQYVTLEHGDNCVYPEQ